MYGPHGNVLGQTSDPYGTPVTSITAYYNGSQYFQKKSVTDGLGRVMTFGVGDKGGADPTDAARPAALGNKGNVLWVRDAGYAVSGNPSNGKQFTYTYNVGGQKLSETDLSGVVSNYTYGSVGTITDPWGNLTQVVQDAGAGKLNRTTSMSYDGAGHVSELVNRNETVIVGSTYRIAGGLSPFSLWGSLSASSGGGASVLGSGRLIQTASGNSA